MGLHTRTIALATMTAGLAAASVLAPASASSAPAVTRPVVVVSGLNNPRQLSLVANQVLLIAEAGKGGTLVTSNDPENGPQGFGYTGSISAVTAPSRAHGQSPRRIISGLYSSASLASDQGPAGSGALGPDGVSARSLSDISILNTYLPRNTVPPASQRANGALLETQPFRRPVPVANIHNFEQRFDPDKQGPDSDPYAVLQLPGRTLVADAAGNDIVSVDLFGRSSVFHVFPNIVDKTCSAPELQQPAPAKPGCQFVPTSLAVDPAGNIYVGGLGGLVPGEGRVVELSSDGTKVLRQWGSFTSVSGVAVSASGEVYVSQLFAPEKGQTLIQGLLTKLAGRTRINVDVPFPAGVAVDAQDNVYVSAFSIAPDTGLGVPGADTSGQVWRLKF